jgi:hypothetical protein
VAYARISLTLPKALLAAADRRARELDRSRSWLIADALAAYLKAAPAGQRGQVREAATVPYAARIGLGEQRLAQLRADLALTPEARVREAEATSRQGPPRSARWTGVLTFDRFEDYLAWKRREAAGG